MGTRRSTTQGLPPIIVGEADRRPRWLRRFLPTAWAAAAPLDEQQLAELKFIAYH